MERGVEQVFDEVLILYALEGRRDALDRLARRWHPRHLAHARRLLGRADWAADAVQEAWVSIVRGLWRLQDPARFPAWSYAIVTRRCHDLLRASGAPEIPMAEDHEPKVSDATEAVSDLRRGLRSLSLEQQAAVALFYREGLSVAEIAEALDVPVGTVKTRLFHARRLLRQFFLGGTEDA
jgi:RNA polymerase sigma-70 factor (ECF subfamily)